MPQRPFPTIRFTSSTLPTLVLAVVGVFYFTGVNIAAVAAAEAVYERTPAHPSFQEVARSEIVEALQSLRPSPRLLLTADAVDSARENVRVDPRWKGYYDALAEKYEAALSTAPVERVLEGRRLLGVSRTALGRIFSWSFLYRYTNDEKFAQRVEKESLAIASFSDWNPSHFLDVAEMTTAMAIGYDSCKDSFAENNRLIIREAIWRLGVLESLKFKGGWKRNTANWNQVCWCGALFGALAIIDELDQERKELATDAILDAVNGITWSMSSYEPDGNYTEGPGYWAYGTGFNTMALDALTTSLSNDFGRSQTSGFLKTIHYFEHVFGTFGDAFNYPDSGGGKFFEATAFWFSRKMNDPKIVWNEQSALDAAYSISQGRKSPRPGAKLYKSLVGDRLAVCALLWGSPKSNAESDKENAFSYEAPNELGYVGIGNQKCCVALFRTAWNPLGAYLGIKCGVPNSPHGHLDEGGFVYDDLGVRWVAELGPESYHRIESRGMNLWNMSQNSDRWKLLRYNNYGHSVPTINGAPQIVDGVSRFIETKIGDHGEPSRAVIDLTPTYRSEIKTLTRKATLFPDGTLEIEDTFEAKTDKDAKIERRFIVRDSAALKGKVVYLTQDNPNDANSKLCKQVETSSTIPFETNVLPCESEEEYDSPNPGVSVILETATLRSGETATFTTRFTTADPSAIQQ